MDRALRRYNTQRKLKKRERMLNDFGEQQGILYEKHVKKIRESSGYMRDGNVSHYVSCGFGRKTRGDRGDDWSPRDVRQMLRECDY